MKYIQYLIPYITKNNIYIFVRMEQSMQNENKQKKSNKIGFVNDEDLHDQHVEGIHL